MGGPQGEHMAGSNAVMPRCQVGRPAAGQAADRPRARLLVRMTVPKVTFFAEDMLPALRSRTTCSVMQRDWALSGSRPSSGQGKRLFRKFEVRQVMALAEIAGVMAAPGLGSMTPATEGGCARMAQRLTICLAHQPTAIGDG